MAELGFFLIGLAGSGFMALALLREHTMPRHTIWEHGANASVLSTALGGGPIDSGEVVTLSSTFSPWHPPRDT